MAKVIKYKFLSCEVNHGTKENPVMEQIFLEKFMDWNEANEEIAKCEAHNGKYIIEDDGQPDPTETPTQLDRIEAQVAYNSIMLGTLMEV